MTTTEIPAGRQALLDAVRTAQALTEAIGVVVRGKPLQVRHAVVALLAGGHVLLEDVPGVGKTLLAKTLARAIAGSFRRVQGTPDLLPADLTGVSVLDHAEGVWRFRPGPLFANVVLVDEVNRATPRTQSALLEAMEERQVSADGVTRPLPSPFIVIATQNPHDHAGTFPLVEGQRDRFTMIIRMGLPDRESEREILTGGGGTDLLADLVPVASAVEVHEAAAAVRGVHVAPSLLDYVLDVVAATRDHEDVALGASPRAALSLLRAVQAHAVVEGRAFATPDDVKAVAPAALAHRIFLPGGPDLRRGTATVEAILRRLPPPRA
jgi:MoxR-like ATPase